jgi:hypothetical protein
MIPKQHTVSGAEVESDTSPQDHDASDLA